MDQCANKYVQSVLYAVQQLHRGACANLNFCPECAAEEE